MDESDSCDNDADDNEDSDGTHNSMARGIHCVDRLIYWFVLFFLECSTTTEEDEDDDDMVHSTVPGKFLLENDDDTDHERGRFGW